MLYVEQDNRGRMSTYSQLDHIVDKKSVHLQQGDEVSILIGQDTALGTKVIINDSYWGLIHASDIFGSLNFGKKMRAYIKNVREDGKIDVVLRKIGRDHISD